MTLVKQASKYTKIDREKLEAEGMRERESIEALMRSVVKPPEYFIPILGPNGKPAAGPRIRRWADNERTRNWKFTEDTDDHGRNLRDDWYATGFREVLDGYLADVRREAKSITPRQLAALEGFLVTMFDADAENAFIREFDSPGDAARMLGQLKKVAVSLYEETQVKYGDVAFRTDVYQRSAIDIARKVDHPLHHLRKKGLDG